MRRIDGASLLRYRFSSRNNVARIGRGRERQTLALPHLRGPLDRREIERALSLEPFQGPDRAFGGLRPAHADRLRQRPRAGAGRGRQGRRADLPSGRHAGALRPDPAGTDEHLDDDQRHGAVAVVALHRRGRGAGRGRLQAARHGPERHHQGIPVARHLYLPAEALAEDDHRRRGLYGKEPAEMEPDECLFLPPARGRRDARAGAGLCPGHRHRGAG